MNEFSLQVMLTNLSQSFNALVLLIVAVSYVTGVSLVVRGVMMYRQFANQTLASAHRGEIAGPMVFIVIGAILIYFPSTLSSSLTTIFGSTDIKTASEMFGYLSLQDNQTKEIANVIVKYVKLVGLIAFVRGWIILSKMGHSGSQPGSVGKGIIHIVGGVLLINIVDTFNILATTFGYTGG